VTIRWRADDYTGKSLAHCHIFSHSDTGMQGPGGREGGRKWKGEWREMCPRSLAMNVDLYLYDRDDPYIRDYQWHDHAGKGDDNGEGGREVRREERVTGGAAAAAA